jgi:hypothetical protein
MPKPTDRVHIIIELTAEALAQMCKRFSNDVAERSGQARRRRVARPHPRCDQHLAPRAWRGRLHAALTPPGIGSNRGGRAGQGDAEALRTTMQICDWCKPTRG